MSTAVAPTLNLDAALEAMELRWRDYKKDAEPLGLAFGESLYKVRELVRAQGQRTKGNGVVPYLEERKISTSTAYYWLNRFEESIGEREVKPKEKWGKALTPDTTLAPEITSTDEPAVITDADNYPDLPTAAPAIETEPQAPKTWTRADEKRKHRDGAHDFEELRALSIEALKIGFKQLWETKKDNHSALASAKTWAIAELSQ